MKHQLIIIVLAVAAHTGWSQKTIKGAYEGELVVRKSLLIINQQKDSVIRGLVYSSLLEYVPFYGLYSKREIRGTIFMPADKGDVVIIYGKLNKDTLYVTLISSIDSTVMVKSKLVKVSGSVSYNLEKTFGKISPQYDPHLVGTWVYLYEIKEDGQKAGVKPFLNGLTIDYWPNGTYSIYIPELAELTARYSTPASQRVYIRNTWFTHDGKLTTKTQMHVPPSTIERAAQMGMPTPSPSDLREFTIPYQIKGDTLIKTEKNNTKT
ncbi:MAG: hypothetical protein L6Q51_01435 [Cyclobacteriaceae bacterium]|nr:hypothetical protein [Cyclobacteriaceae bacterium]